jgi:hypothetical protein
LALAEALGPIVSAFSVSSPSARDIGEHGFARLPAERACEMAEHRDTVAERVGQARVDSRPTATVCRSSAASVA